MKNKKEAEALRLARIVLSFNKREDKSLLGSQLIIPYRSDRFPEAITSITINIKDIIDLCQAGIDLTDDWTEFLLKKKRPNRRNG